MLRDTVGGQYKCALSAEHNTGDWGPNIYIYIYVYNILFSRQPPPLRYPFVPSSPA